MRIIISGGGIGGLTMALCALHFGHSVTVLEKSPALDEVGAGIQIPPNAMKVFQALGIADALTERAFYPQALETRIGISGRSLFRLSTERWDAPYLHIHRADYIRVLAAALPPTLSDAIHFHKDVTGYTQNADSVTVHCADGTQHSGDVLVGADGIHSPIRAQMHGGASPNFTGNVAWRAVVPTDSLGADAPPPTACVWLGKGRHCVTYFLKGGELVNFVGVVEGGDWQIESWHERGKAQDALADFDGWHPTITRILREADALYRWALFDRPALLYWSDGRVALLGDAAHPMLPFMAQGAAMAVEDAWALAKYLAGESSVAQALQAYQAIRHPRTAYAQKRARANGKAFHSGSIMTYSFLWITQNLFSSVLYKRLDPLYSYDITLLG